jgi:hypothetical protein
MNLLNEDGAPPTMRCPPRFDITRLSEPCGVRNDAPAISGRLCHLADIRGADIRSCAGYSPSAFRERRAPVGSIAGRGFRQPVATEALARAGQTPA